VAGLSVSRKSEGLKMKKLLLASSALVVMGGAAFAQDISFTASAGVTAGNWDGASDNVTFSTDLVASAEHSAGGLTFGGSVEVNGEVAMDHTGNTTDTGVSINMLYVSGNFGKLEFAPDEWDVSADEVGDLRYTGSFGDVALEAIYDMQNDEYLLGANYSGNGFNVGLEHVNDGLNPAGTVNTLSADVDLGGYTIGGSFADDNSWDVFASTEFNGIMVKGTYDDADVFGLELSGSTGGVDWSADADSTGTGGASVSTSFGDTTVSLSYDGSAYNSTGDDAMVVARVEHTVGNITLHAQANQIVGGPTIVNNSEYEVGAEASFDF